MRNPSCKASAVVNKAALLPAVTLGSITACVELARVSRDALFITTIGASAIPTTYLAVAFVMFILSALYASTVRRLGVYNLLRLFLCICGVFLVGSWFALEIALLPRKPITYALFCAIEAFFIFLPLAFWALMNERYSLAEGARIFPSVGVGGVLGVVIGGTFPRLMESLASPTDLLFVAGCLVVPPIFLSSAICSNTKDYHFHTDPLVESSRNSLWDEPLVRTLTYLALPMWILVYVIEYTYFESLGRVFDHESDLAGFLGLVVSTASIVGLLVQLIVTPTLLRIMGVGTTAVVYPFALAGCGVLILVYSMFPDAISSNPDLGGVVALVVVSRLTDLALYFSVQESSLHLLFYAIPSSKRPKARALISGTIFPLSIGLAGALLLIFKATEQPIYSIAFAGMTIGFLLLVIALNIAPDYLRSRLGSAAKDNPVERENLVNELANLSDNETRYVYLEAILSKNLSEALFAAEMLSKQADDEVICDLAEIADAISPEALRQFVNTAPATLFETGSQDAADLLVAVTLADYQL